MQRVSMHFLISNGSLICEISFKGQTYKRGYKGFFALDLEPYFLSSPPLESEVFVTFASFLAPLMLG